MIIWSQFPGTRTELCWFISPLRSTPRQSVINKPYFHSSRERKFLFLLTHFPTKMYIFLNMQMQWANLWKALAYCANEIHAEKGARCTLSRGEPRWELVLHYHGTMRWLLYTEKKQLRHRQSGRDREIVLQHGQQCNCICKGKTIYNTHKKGSPVNVQFWK